MAHKAKHETINEPLLFYCFVDFGRELTDAPKCWVLPSALVSDVLTISHQAWFNAPGKGGKARKDHDMRRLLPDDSVHKIGKDKGWLDPYREAWNLISELSLNASSPN